MFFMKNKQKKFIPYQERKLLSIQAENLNNSPSTVSWYDFIFTTLSNMTTTIVLLGFSIGIILVNVDMPKTEERTYSLWAGSLAIFLFLSLSIVIIVKSLGELTAIKNKNKYSKATSILVFTAFIIVTYLIIAMIKAAGDIAIQNYNDVKQLKGMLQKQTAILEKQNLILEEQRSKLNDIYDFVNTKNKKSKQ